MKFPVTIEIKPSRRLRAALVFVHAAAFVALGLRLSVMTWPVALAAALPLLVSLWVLSRHQVPSRLRLAPDGQLYALQAAGAAKRLQLLPGAVVYRWLVVVRTDDGQRRRPLVVLADSLAPGDFRALRLWLRWRAEFRPSRGRA